MANVSSSNSQKALVPKLRFHDANGAEFPQLTPETVGTLFSHISRRNSDMKNNNVITNSAEFGLIPQRDFFDKDIAVEGNTDKYYIISRGDFVYNPRKSTTAPYGPFNCYQGEEEGIVSPLYTCLKPLYPEMANYLLWYFRSPAWYSYIYHNGAQGGARHDRVGMTNDLMDGIPVNLPCKTEQKKISEFLTLLDKRIAAQQHLVEVLKSYKRGALSRLFPKKGASVPEYRFAGFSGDWEERKLNELCSLFTDGDWIESKDQSESGIRLIQTGNVGVTEYLDKPSNKKWVSHETFERLHCTEVKSGDILISRLPEPAGRACIMPNIGQKMITAVDCTIARIDTKYCPEYVVQYLSTQTYFDKVNNCLAGGTRQRISRGNLSDFLIPLPTSKNEQEQIGEFFRHLDDLIILYQQEVSINEKIKNGLLQGLFI